PSGALSGLYLPLFSTNLVASADLQDAGVNQFTPARRRDTHCTDADTGRHLTTFTRGPGSSLYTLTVPSPPPASGQAAASGQVFAAASRMGHPSLPRLRGMASRLLVSGLPRSLPPLPPGPGPPCVPSVEGRLRATPHSSPFPPTEAPDADASHGRVGPSPRPWTGSRALLPAGVDETTRINLQTQGLQTGDLPSFAVTGKVGDASAFRVWGSRAFVRDLSADKLSPRAAPCVFLGFPPVAPGWQFYHPTSRRVLSSQDVTFDESVPFYRLFPYRTPSLPPRPSSWSQTRSGLSRSLVTLVLLRVWSLGVLRLGVLRLGVLSLGVLRLRVLRLGVLSLRVLSLGVLRLGVLSLGVLSLGVLSLGVLRLGVLSLGVLSLGVLCLGVLSLGVLRLGVLRLLLLFLVVLQTVLRAASRSLLWSCVSGLPGAGRRAAGAGGTAGAGGSVAAEGAGTTGPGGARTEGTGAAGPGGASGAGAAAGAGAEATTVGPTAGTSAAAGGAGVGAATGAGAASGGVGPVPAVSGGAARPRPYFVPLLLRVLGLPPSTGPSPPVECPQPVPSRSQLQPASPLPSPSPYAGPTGGLAERREPASRPVSPVRAARPSGRGSRQRPPRVPGTHQMSLRPSTAPLRAPLPSPPQSSLPTLADPESDSHRAASPTVTRLLATLVTDPSFESATASALVAELVDFAAACRLDYAASLVAESAESAESASAASASACPPSVGGDCALGTDVLEDRQEEFQCFAAALPHLVSMLVAPEGDPDALDIPTPRSYAEAMAGPYSSQCQSAMDAEMASWKSTGTYVDAVPPPGANIVSGMWIFRVKRPPGSPPVFKARYGRLHEEIWLRRPPGFTGSFPPGTQWSLRRPVYGLRQAPREWHDTLRTTLAALGFAPSTADPSLFLRTDTSLPPFYILVYVDDLVFATADTAALAHVKSELQKRHTCLCELGEPG
ncbi:unnamed protein product, partial [Closterium sp. NIES-64]